MHAAQTVSLMLERPTVMFALVNVMQQEENGVQTFQEHSTVSWYRGHLFFQPLSTTLLEQENYQFLKAHSYGSEDGLAADLQWHQSPNGLIKDYLLYNSTCTTGEQIVSAAIDLFVGREMLDKFHNSFDFETHAAVVNYFHCRRNDEADVTQDSATSCLIRLLHVPTYPPQGLGAPDAFRNANNGPFTAGKDAYPSIHVGYEDSDNYWNENRLEHKMKVDAREELRPLYRKKKLPDLPWDMFEEYQAKLRKKFPTVPVYMEGLAACLRPENKRSQDPPFVRVSDVGASEQGGDCLFAIFSHAIYGDYGKHHWTIRTMLAYFWKSLSRLTKQVDELERFNLLVWSLTPSLESSTFQRFCTGVQVKTNSRVKITEPTPRHIMSAIKSLKKQRSVTGWLALLC